MRCTAIAITGCVLAASFGLAGCGGSSNSGGDDAATLLAATSDKTAAAQNAKIDLEMTYITAQGDSKVHGSGAADLVKHSYRTTFATIDGSRTVDEVVIGPKVWLRLPEASRSKTDGKAWVLMSTGSSAADSYNQDPTAYLAALKHYKKSVSKLGHETLHGVKTTHYRADITLSDSAKLSGTDTNSEKSLQNLVGGGDLPIDIYLDNQGLTRRVQIQFSIKKTSATPAAKTTVIMDYYDFGKADISGIVPPPAADTIESSKTTLFG